MVLAPHNTLSDLDAVKEKYGHYGIPVTIDGRLHSKLVGIVPTDLPSPDPERGCGVMTGGSTV